MCVQRGRWCDGAGEVPGRGCTVRRGDALVGSNLKQTEQKSAARIVPSVVSILSPSVNTKAPESAASNFYSVNLQTRMAGIHWQRAVTEQGDTPVS